MNIFHWPELLTFSIFPSSSRPSRSLSSVTSLRDSRARVFSSSSWSVTAVRDSSSSVSWFLWRNSRLLWERSSSHELKQQMNIRTVCSLFWRSCLSSSPSALALLSVSRSSSFSFVSEARFVWRVWISVLCSSRTAERSSLSWLNWEETE